MTHTDARRTLEELRTVYRLHPRLRDVFVEGRCDARFMRHHLEGASVSVLRIAAVGDAVEVPDQLLIDRGIEVGERGRLLVLSEFIEAWLLDEPSATCVVDSDFDVLDPRIPRRDCLLATDYASIEVYGLLARPLAKFFSSVGAHGDHAEIVERLGFLWRTLFVLRFVLHVDHAVHLNDKYLRRCSVKGDRVEVDVDSIVQVSIPSCSRSKARAVASRVSVLREGLAVGGLHGIRGHDIAPVLIWYLRLNGDFRHEETVERMLLACVESVDVIEQPLFRRLCERLSV